jgi:hypothetical protein
MEGRSRSLYVRLALASDLARVTVDVEPADVSGELLLHQQVEVTGDDPALSLAYLYIPGRGQEWTRSLGRLRRGDHHEVIYRVPRHFLEGGDALVGVRELEGHLRFANRAVPPFPGVEEKK